MREYPPRIWVYQNRPEQEYKHEEPVLRADGWNDNDAYISLKEHQALLAVAVEALSSITKDFRCECSFDYDGALLKNCPWCIAEYTIAELRGEK